MATVVSFKNMKGGVGKTTLAVQIAHAADERGLRVLAVDLDPQSNLSQSLLGAESYIRHLHENRPTITEVFEGFRPPSKKKPAPRRVRIQDIIVKEAGYWDPCTLDLIPSRLELARTLQRIGANERRLAEGAPIAETSKVRWWVSAGFQAFAKRFFESIGMPCESDIKESTAHTGFSIWS